MRLISLSCVIMLSIGTLSAETTSALKWFKGNTHTHTTVSDGDSTPGLVARWYRDHKYDFLVLSDHNKYNELTELQSKINSENQAAGAKPFLLIPGEEVSDSFEDDKRGYALHINAIGTSEVVGKQGGGSVVEVLQNCIDAIHAKGGIPHVNHPNFVWSITAQDLAQLRGLKHFEIYNGHPIVNNLGGGGIPGVEAIWDILLSQDKRVFGVAVDDAHNYIEFARHKANPGRGWIVVRAPELTQSAIVSAFESGNYYASTGVTLDEITTSNKTLAVTIAKMDPAKFRTEFIGQDGKVLATDETMTPSYTLKPGDMYVRARVQASNGDVAWTQPLFP